jgi:hypothetical protein
MGGGASVVLHKLNWICPTTDRHVRVGMVNGSGVWNGGFDYSKTICQRLFIFCYFWQLYNKHNSGLRLEIVLMLLGLL